MSKQVTIHLARRVTLNRAGHAAVELAGGWNTVDVDVASHPFVKAHTVDAGPDNSGELDDLRAKLSSALDEIEDRGDAIEHFRKENAAIVKERDAAIARVTDLEEQLAQKVADMDALVASMTPPAAPAVDAKPAKAKA